MPKLFFSQLSPFFHLPPLPSTRFSPCPLPSLHPFRPFFLPGTQTLDLSTASKTSLDVSPSLTRSLPPSASPDLARRSPQPQVFQPQHTLGQEFSLLNLDNIANLELERVGLSLSLSLTLSLSLSLSLSFPLSLSPPHLSLKHLKKFLGTGGLYLTSMNSQIPPLLYLHSWRLLSAAAR